MTISVNSESDPLGSQKGQVRFVLECVFNYSKNGLKRNGYFVDLGGGHPIENNNAFFMEKHLGWHRLIIEPNPHYFFLLSNYRSSTVLQRAISSTTGSTRQFRFDNMSLGGFVGDAYDNNSSNRGEELKDAELSYLETHSLADTFLEFASPAEMDYLSLDVEGAVHEVLLGIDFDK